VTILPHQVGFFTRLSSKISYQDKYPHIVAIDPLLLEVYEAGLTNERKNPKTLPLTRIIQRAISAMALLCLIPILAVVLSIMGIIGLRSRSRIALERELLNDIERFSKNNVFGSPLDQPVNWNSGTHPSEMCKEMYHNLNYLPWKRLDVYIPRILNTHGPIICRNPWLFNAGADVVAHFVDNFLLD
jgi:hypothetical protein